MVIDDHVARVLTVRHYPNFLTDRLMKKWLDLGLEMAISINAEPYEPEAFDAKLANAQALAKMELIRGQKDGMRDGVVDPELATSGVARETNHTTERWREETTENDQKAFSGVMSVYLIAKDLDTLNKHTAKVKSAGRAMGVRLEECYYYQEEGLNTNLPIGQPFLNVKQRLMRDMLSTNIATQVPFTNVDLHSDSPKAIYYGQNQLSHNVITLDRKRDLNASNGMVAGSTGSGKGMTVKTTEIIPTILRYPEDRIIIVDPEREVRQEVVL